MAELAYDGRFARAGRVIQEPAGYHKGCGGTVSQILIPAQWGEPPDVVLVCSQCPNELDESEICEDEEEAASSDSDDA